MSYKEDLANQAADIIANGIQVEFVQMHLASAQLEATGALIDKIEELTALLREQRACQTTNVLNKAVTRAALDHMPRNFTGADSVPNSECKQ